MNIQNSVINNWDRIIWDKCVCPRCGTPGVRTIEMCFGSFILIACYDCDLTATVLACEVPCEKVYEWLQHQLRLFNGMPEPVDDSI